MKAARVLAALFLIAAVSLAKKFYQPGEKVLEKMMEIELKRDAYKYGGTPYIASEQGKTGCIFP